MLTLIDRYIYTETLTTMYKIKGFVLLPLLLVVALVLGTGVLIYESGKSQGLVKSEAATLEVDRQVDLTPLEDSYVVKTSATSTNGTKQTLLSGGSAGNISFLKFDLSQINGKKISSVKLSLNVTDSSSNSNSISYSPTNNWTEGNLNYNNRPTSLIPVSSFTPNKTGSYVVDFTSLIGAATTTKVTNVTIAISSQGTDIFGFTSKEGSTKPTLSVYYKETIQVTPSPTPTGTTKPTPTATQTSAATTSPSANPQPSSGGTGNADWVKNAVWASSYHIWDPTLPLYQQVGPQKYPICSRDFHDSFFVIGPDGKKYPTWHPTVAVDPATGVKCAFGHDHGRNPANSAIWNQVQENFYFDANRNGKMDADEQKVAGIPFGYANEQLDVYSKANGKTTMRHEDHVGHKVEYMNGEADAGSELGNSTTGGVYVPIKTNSTPKWKDSGMHCYYFSKMHQGVHSADAFGNNLHEVVFLADCKGPTAEYDMKSAVTQMVQFGAPGEFTNICDGAGDRTTPVVVGKNDMNADWPGTRGRGFRGIVQRACIEKFFLVPLGKFSSNAYEAWAGTLAVRNTAGKAVISDINITLDVEDAIRYYDPSKPNGVGYSMDLCYEKLAGGVQARSGDCDAATNYGRIQGITWNDPRSAFLDLSRGLYFQWNRLTNAGGPEVWYSDPFGNNAQTSAFPGSIAQRMTAKNVDVGKLGPIDPRVSDRTHDDGEGTVHAPN